MKKNTRTIGELWDFYWTRHASQCKSASKMEYHYKKSLAHWSERRACSILPEEVDDLKKSFGKKTEMANRTLEILRRMYAFSLAWCFYQGSDPTRAVPLNKRKKRTRFLEEDEFPLFYREICKIGSQKVRDYLLICIFNGQRMSTVKTMRWSDVHLDRGIWIVPADAPGNKNGEPWPLPLADEVVAILKRRRSTSSMREIYVFPSRFVHLRGSKFNGYMAPPYRQWNDIKEAVGIPDVIIHDLRRTFGTYACAVTENPFLIARSMGHKNLASTSIYAMGKKKGLKALINETVNSLLRTVSEDNSAGSAPL